MVAVRRLFMDFTDVLIRRNLHFDCIGLETFKTLLFWLGLLSQFLFERTSKSVSLIFDLVHGSILPMKAYFLCKLLHDIIFPTLRFLNLWLNFLFKGAIDLTSSDNFLPREFMGVGCCKGGPGKFLFALTFLRDGSIPLVVFVHDLFLFDASSKQ
jgi:hypothetical protein